MIRSNHWAIDAIRALSTNLLYRFAHADVRIKRCKIWLQSYGYMDFIPSNRLILQAFVHECLFLISGCAIMYNMSVDRAPPPVDF